MNKARELVQGDVWILDDRIAEIGQVAKPAEIVIDATGQTLIPGFIQTHIHLCQTLFRNAADDLSLLDWLDQRILPLEAAHTPDSLRASAKLGIAELIKSGTTTILDMGTVHHHDVVFEELANSGLRAISGKCMMDVGDAPAGLCQTCDQAIGESLALAKKWHGYANNRIRYAFAPRFGLSCSENLMQQTLRLAIENGYLFHSHAAETKDEVAWIRNRTGMANIEYLHSRKLLSPWTLLAHCIWVSDAELKLLAETGTRVLHCPSANCKLGSGIARVPEMRALGILVSLGADGAACNNNLDMFTEMRLAAFIQKLSHGPQALSAQSIFEMATIDGAKTLGLAPDVGTIEVGKKADLVLIQTDQIHNQPAEDIYGQLVYSCRSSDVRTVLIDGQILAQDGILSRFEEKKLVLEAKKQRQILMEKI